MKLRKILFLIGTVLALLSPSVFSDENSNDQEDFELEVAVCRCPFDHRAVPDTFVLPGASEKQPVTSPEKTPPSFQS
jgi:hypothetical protein